MVIRAARAQNYLFVCEYIITGAGVRAVYWNKFTYRRMIMQRLHSGFDLAGLHIYRAMIVSVRVLYFSPFQLGGPSARGGSRLIFQLERYFRLQDKFQRITSAKVPFQTFSC